MQGKEITYLNGMFTSSAYASERVEMHDIVFDVLHSL
jgi:hypothetical protein